jgi:hypothetical protein
MDLLQDCLQRFYLGTELRIERFAYGTPNIQEYCTY